MDNLLFTKRAEEELKTSNILEKYALKLAEYNEDCFCVIYLGQGTSLVIRYVPNFTSFGSDMSFYGENKKD